MKYIINSSKINIIFMKTDSNSSYTDYQWILIRDNEASNNETIEWKIDDCGY